MSFLGNINKTCRFVNWKFENEMMDEMDENWKYFFGNVINRCFAVMFITLLLLNFLKLLILIHNNINIIILFRQPKQQFVCVRYLLNYTCSIIQ